MFAFEFFEIYRDLSRSIRYKILLIYKCYKNFIKFFHALFFLTFPTTQDLTNCAQ